MLSGELVYESPTRKIWRDGKRSCYVEAEPIRRAVSIIDQEGPLRGSISVTLTNTDTGDACEVGVSNALDTTNDINIKWQSTTIVGGLCNGRNDTIRERIFCNFDTATGYGDNFEFSAVTMKINISSITVVSGLPVVDEFRFYSGHAEFPGSLSSSQNFNIPNKNRQTILIPGGATTGLKTFNLASTCLYPVQMTEFRICGSYEEDSNTSKQGYLNCDKFYPKLSYTVNMKRFLPFWAGVQ